MEQNTRSQQGGGRSLRRAVWVPGGRAALALLLAASAIAAGSMAAGGPSPARAAAAMALAPSVPQPPGYDHAILLPLVRRSYPFVPPPDDIENGDFEAGRTGWTEISDEYPSRALIVSGADLPAGTPPRSGAWLAWLGGEDAIGDTYTSALEQRVTVPPDRPVLVYYHWIRSEDDCGYDFASVLLDGTAVWTYDLCTPRDTGGWVRAAVDLSAYAGQSVMLRIRAQNDWAFTSHLFVEDVAFAAAAEGQAPAR